jgi:hypothetical protein
MVSSLPYHVCYKNDTGATILFGCFYTVQEAKDFLFGWKRAQPERRFEMYHSSNPDQLLLVN